MKKIEPKKNTKAKKLICDWTVEKNIWFIIGCWNFVRHGMVVEKINETLSIKRSKWLGKIEKF